MDWVMMCVRICCLLSLLYFFIFGIDLMGTSFKVLGGAQAGDLFSAVDNPIAGLMVGVLATVLVQSSSTSTSIVVGMVGADIISVKDAIPVIMGANIGTSVTNTLVSMGQMNDLKQLERAFAGATVHDCFNFLAVLVLLPIECASNMLYYLTKEMTSGLDGSAGGKFKGPLKYIVSPLTKEWIQADKKKINKIAEGKLSASNAGTLVKGGFVEPWSDDAGAAFCLVVSLIILCLALFGIVKLLQYMVLGRAQNIIKKSLKFAETWWGGYLAILVGLGVTICVQSSSITTSTLTPLVGVGVITVNQMYPLTLGANVGTTCTALLAALVSEKKAALQIALCHLMFNIISTLMFYPVPITRLPIPMCQFLGSMVVNLGRWFPMAYLIFCFFLFPLLIFGISAMFADGGPVGIAFGIIIVVGLLAGLAYLIYWWNFKDGRAWVIAKAQLMCGPVKDFQDDEDTETNQSQVGEVGVDMELDPKVDAKGADQM
jgi:sodium-dependent phosphate cotransporter